MKQQDNPPSKATSATKDQDTCLEEELPNKEFKKQ
jgi:hypothetical protein